MTMEGSVDYVNGTYYLEYVIKYPGSNYLGWQVEQLPPGVYNFSALLGADHRDQQILNRTVSVP